VAGRAELIVIIEEVPETCPLPLRLQSVKP